MHQDDVYPAAKFEADRGQNADPGEAQRRVQADRRPRTAAADYRDHLTVAEFAAVIQYGCEEGFSEAAPDFRLIDVDRVLECDL